MTSEKRASCTPRGARYTWLAAFALLCGGVSSCAPTLDDAGQQAAGPDLTGVLEVRTLDHQDGGSSRQYSLVFDEVERVRLTFDADPNLPAGTELSISGEWKDDRTFLVREWSRLSVPKRLDAPLSRQPMKHRVAVLATGAASVTEAQAKTQMSEASKFFVETTRGVDTFSMEVFRRYDVALSTTDCQYNNSDTIADRLIAAFTKDGFNPSNYDHIATIVPRSCGSDWSGAWAGVGSIRNDGSLRFSRISMYKDNVFDPWFLAHELGHNLGMEHAQAATCGSSVYNTGLSGCTISEYGDHNDLMGNGEGVYWNGAHQRFLGWIAPQRVVTARSGGTFNLIPVDAVGQGCGIQALRIPIPNDAAKYFYVEYRKARSDSPYAGTGDFGRTRGDAVLITRSQDGLDDQSSTQRLELGTTRYRGAEVGTRYDLGGGVSVQVSATGAQSARVVIQTPGSSAPRDDAGATLSALSDGSFGPSFCGAPPPDACPTDPNKTEPGQCGCGVPEGTCTTTPSIEVVTNPVLAATPIEVRFRNMPGNSTDWAAIYAAGTSDQSYLQYLYLGGLTNGSVTFNARSAGNYEARLFVNDTYQRVAQVPFTVASAPTPDNCPNDPNKTEPGACGCGVPEGTCGPKTVSLSVDDTYVDSANPGRNFGTSTTLSIDNSPAVHRTLIKPVGLSSVPRGARVESAQLVLTVFDGGHSLSVRKLTGNFSEGSVTYATAPGVTSSAFASVSGSLGTKTIDVTAVVQAWVNGETPFGIALYPTGTNGVDIYSAEHTTAANRPFFRVTYR